MCWFILIMPELRRLREEDYNFEASLGYIASLTPS
jgi:hypothetical protein